MDDLSGLGGGERLLPVILMEDISGRCAAPPQPLPLPPDDLLLEILLRLPPEPIHLLRAALVSKDWRRLVHDARFLRRFRAFHGAPPVLGFLNSQPGPPLFVPTSAPFAVPSTMTTDAWWPLDCRHARALLKNTRSRELVVWDLMSGEKRCLPPPPAAFDDNDGGFNGAVLRAPGNDVDRIGCRSCPFLVALLLTDGDLASACVYSSETGVWGEATSVATQEDIQMDPTALVRDTLLYWQLTGGVIIEFDMGKHTLDVIEVPSDVFCSYDQIVLMPAEDGGIGFAGVDDLSLHLFSRMASIADGTLEWMLRRTIDLEKFLAPNVVMRPRSRTFSGVEAISFAEDADVIFIYVDLCVYMLHLKSMQFDEVSEKGWYSSVHPYSSFYTAVLPCKA